MNFGARVSNEEILQQFSWEGMPHRASTVALRYYVLAENLIGDLPTHDKHGHREDALRGLKLSMEASIRARCLTG